MVLRNQLRIGGALVAIAAGIAFIAMRRTPKATQLPPKPAAVAVFQGSEATVPGRVEARKTKLVGAPIEGILESYFVDIGHEVYKDQLLGRIRNGELEAAQQTAQSAIGKTEARLVELDAEAIAARLDVSRTAADQSRAQGEIERLEKIYQRQKALMDAGATARLTFEQAEREYLAAKTDTAKRDAELKSTQERVIAIEQNATAAQALLAQQSQALEKARADLATGDIHSPSDGIVLKRRGQPGEPVDPSIKDLLEIATDLTSLQVTLTPDPPVLARIHTGQQAAVRVAESADELPGTIREVRDTEVIVDFTSPTAITKLGTIAQVRIKF